MHRSFGTSSDGGSRGAAAVALVLLAGCTGLSLGENEPGAGTNLEAGSIAVDDRTETVFVMACDRDGESGCTGAESRSVVAIDPDLADVADTWDVSGLDQVRIAFPQNAVFLVGERGSGEQIRVLDPDTLAESTRVEVGDLPSSIRMSPGRGWLLFGNAFQFDLFDAAALEDHRVAVAPDDRIDAAWAHTEDRLVVAGESDPETGTPSVVVRTWSVADLVASDFAVSGDSWANPDFETTLEGVELAELGAGRSVVVAPDDAHAAVALRRPDGTQAVALVEMPTGEARLVEDAEGRPGFTPDGSTLVAFQRPAGEGPSLLLVDVETLATESLALPWPDAPTFFVTREGSQVVVASNIGDEQLVLVDVDLGETTTLGGPRIGLNEFVSRTAADELWIVDDGLYRLDLMGETLETMSLGWTPAHINILVSRDWLVMDDADGSRIRFWDPAAQSTVGDVPLPSP